MKSFLRDGEVPTSVLPPLQLNERVQSVSKGGAKPNKQAVIGRIAQLATESDSRWGVVWEEIEVDDEVLHTPHSSLRTLAERSKQGQKAGDHISKGWKLIKENKKKAGDAGEISLVQRSEVVPLCSLADALRDKFTDGAVEKSSPGSSLPASPQRKLLDCGDAGSDALTRARAIQLVASGISTIQMFPRMCPSLLELDLSTNCLTSFADVAWLVNNLPTLRSLNASGNPLRADAAHSLAAPPRCLPD
ncbi:hypothetical protein T484DRAFT_3645667 [Baffinella frigidus]|jgi:hypothetical protein|nr:hypothetical protein T484DRAFT_3645667 [Cryptophyta sp. CCMP2293]